MRYNEMVGFESKVISPWLKRCKNKRAYDKKKRNTFKTFYTFLGKQIQKMELHDPKLISSIPRTVK